MVKRLLVLVALFATVMVWAGIARAYPVVQFSDEYLYHWVETRPGLRLDIHYAGRFPEAVEKVLLFEPLGELWQDQVEDVSLPEDWSYRFLTLDSASYTPIGAGLGILAFTFDEDEYNFGVVLNHGDNETASEVSDFVDMLNSYYTDHLTIWLDGTANPLASLDVTFTTRVLLASPYIALGGSGAYFGNTKSGQPTAVPEPLTAALVGVGGAGLFWRSRKAGSDM